MDPPPPIDTESKVSKNSERSSEGTPLSVSTPGGTPSFPVVEASPAPIPGHRIFRANREEECGYGYNVLVLYTGGTIGMVSTSRGYVCKTGYLQECLLKSPRFQDQSTPPVVSKTGRYILTSPPSRFNKRINYEIVEYYPLLDSSNMDPSNWIRIAQHIRECYRTYDSFIILHGTDTMAYTASVLSFMLENLGKTVLITGSQIPFSQPQSDASDNFLGALTIAGHYRIPEVCIYFDSLLLRGNRCIKSDAEGFRAFSSPNFPPLGQVGIDIKILWNRVMMPSPKSRFRAKLRLCQNVAIVRFYPGISVAIMKNFLLPPIQGVVLQSYGAGNAPASNKPLLKYLKDACDSGVIIVNCTQCTRGSVSDHYVTGKALGDCGVIAAYDCTAEACLTKLCFVLGHQNVLSVSEMKKLFSMSLRGECSVDRVKDTSDIFSYKDYREANSERNRYYVSVGSTVRRDAHGVSEHEQQVSQSEISSSDQVSSSDYDSSDSSIPGTDSESSDSDSSSDDPPKVRQFAKPARKHDASPPKARLVRSTSRDKTDKLRSLAWGRMKSLCHQTGKKMKTHKAPAIIAARKLCAGERKGTVQTMRKSLYTPKTTVLDDWQSKNREGAAIGFHGLLLLLSVARNEAKQTLKVIRKCRSLLRGKEIARDLIPTDQQGRNPLLLACMGGFVRITSLLLSRIPILKQSVDDYGLCAVATALLGPHIPKFLKQEPADEDDLVPCSECGMVHPSNGKSVLTIRGTREGIDNRLELVRTLERHGLQLEKERIGCIFEICVRFGLLDVLEVMRRMGVPIDFQRRSDGKSVMHIAAELGNVEAVKYLLGLLDDSEALPLQNWASLVDAHGNSAVEVARKSGHSQVVDILIEHVLRAAKQQSNAANPRKKPRDSDSEIQQSSSTSRRKRIKRA